MRPTSAENNIHRGIPHEHGPVRVLPLRQNIGHQPSSFPGRNKSADSSDSILRYPYNRHVHARCQP